MAKSKNNIVMQGTSGAIGDMLVFRQVAGQTVISRRPKKPMGDPSLAQQEVRDRFREAAFYTKNIVNDPLQYEVYASKALPGQSAFNMAFKDYMKPPVIKESNISATGYTGAVGSQIRVRAIDDFKVISVTVTLTDTNGSVLESGEAEQSANGIDWLYTATVENASLPGTRITVKAHDRPGNIGQAETVLA